jgi:squalene synthase HpnC
MPVEHYENFPVASFLLPASLRSPVETIYAFARSADDLADEGNALPHERIAALNEYVFALDMIRDGRLPDAGLFHALAHVIAIHNLPLQPFYDLLSAFQQDINVKRYQNFSSLLDYCSRSANPVGLLMLHLYKLTEDGNVRDSNSICSALQLINFLQDIAVDLKKARIYLPQEDLLMFGVSEEQLHGGVINGAWRTLMDYEIARARAMLLSGAPLATRLPGRIGWELRLVIQGGLRILERIEAVDYDIFRYRPQLSKVDWLRMLLRAVRMKAA